MNLKYKRILPYLLKLVEYLCNECKKKQSIEFSDRVKADFIPPKFTGLTLFSHFHVCKGGITGVNNLHIDENLDVRTYSFVKLPEYKKPTGFSIPGAPVQENPRINITHLRNKNDLNLFISNEVAGADIIIGNVSPDRVPQKEFNSTLSMVSVKYFPSNAEMTNYLGKWLQIFTDSMEVLLTSNLGLIIEALLYLLDRKDKFPSPDDTKIIRTILASLDVYISPGEDTPTSEYLQSLYGDQGVLMSKLLDVLTEEWSPDKPVRIHNFVPKLANVSIKDIIYSLLMLEEYNNVSIDRPGILVHV